MSALMHRTRFSRAGCFRAVPGSPAPAADKLKAGSHHTRLGTLRVVRAVSSVVEVDGASPDQAVEALVLAPGDVAAPSPRPLTTGMTKDLTQLFESKRKVPGRPYLPPFDGFLETVLGTSPQDYTSECMKDFVGPHDGPLRLIKPVVPRNPQASADPSTLPLMFYLPGIDGTGLAAYRQFPRIAEAFDLRCIVYPPDDRTPFEDMVDVVGGMVRREVEAVGDGRPVYIMGESFGGLLCMAVAASENGRAVVDRVVAINPATSFATSAWPTFGPMLPNIPKEIYNTLPFLMSPVLTSPFAIAMHGVDEKDPLVTQVSDFAHGLVGLVPELGNLRQVLPAATLGWRVQLLQQGCRYMEGKYSQVKQKVLVLAGERDLLIPSNTEAPALSKKLPRCRHRILEGRSHALLQEAGVDMVQILKDEGFYVDRIQLTSSAITTTTTAPPDTISSTNSSNGNGNGNGHGTSTNGNGRSNGSSTSNQQRQQQRQRSEGVIRSGVGFGEPVPLQVPTEDEVRKEEEKGLGTMKKLVSPVFFSTGEDGRIVEGLGAIPSTRPLLFVGNHQLLAPDLAIIVERFLTERRMLVRGLAHPFALGALGNPSASSADSQMQFGNQMKTFGAVPVSGRNMFQLLQQGEAVMLFPGGAREALKRRGEQYALIWPERSEFVRMAARFGATIIPFAAVGAEDSLNMVLDQTEVEQLPLVGQWLRGQLGTVQQARTGVNVSDVVVDDFLPPLVVPDAPDRFYFLYQKPIVTTPEMADDKELCEKIYKEVKDEVESGMGYLMQKRLADPFRPLLPRLAYETFFNRQAPTFKP